MDDIEAIKQLKARYFRTTDTKDWDEMRQVYAEDVVVDTTASGGTVIAGADDSMAFLRATLGDVVTVHHGHMPEIELTSSTTATGIWAMEDLLRWPHGDMRGLGHYHETYEKTGDLPRPQCAFSAACSRFSSFGRAPDRRPHENHGRTGPL